MSTQPPLNRRFLPVPLETTSRSHKLPESPLTPPESVLGFDGVNDDKENPLGTAGKLQSAQESTPLPIRRQLPRPIETTRRSNRFIESTPQSEDSILSTTTEFDQGEITQAQDDASTPKPPSSARTQPPDGESGIQLSPLKLTASPRFKPQLIETTRRSRRAPQPYDGPIADLASIPSDRSDTTVTPTPRPAVVPHHKLTIWTPSPPSKEPAQRMRRPPARPMDGRSDLLTPQDSRSSSLPPPLRPYRQGSMRPHLNTRMNTRAGSNTDNSTPTGTPDIVLHGFGGDKQLFSSEEVWDASLKPSALASSRPRDSSYSSTPSLSGSFDSSSQSQSQSDSNYIHELSNSQHLARTRESCDERYSGYLLSLAAVAAEQQIKEKQLKEQLESGFPNRDVCYEPVSHWGPGEDEESRANTKSSKDFTEIHDIADDEIQREIGDGPLHLVDSDSDVSDDDFEGPPELPHERLGRKESSQAKHVVDLGNGLLMGIPEPIPTPDEYGMTMEEILAHEAELARLRREATFHQLADEAAAPAFGAPFSTTGSSKKALDAAADLRGEDRKRARELQIMREAAAPPMLGADLVFRTCPSPQRTRCETDQLHSAHMPQAVNGGGLWGGYCVGDGGAERGDQGKRGPQLLETPLETPFNERVDLGMGAMGVQTNTFLSLTDDYATSPTTLSEKARGKRPAHTRLSSGGGRHLLHGLDARLAAEAAKAKREERIRAEFDDAFVTQVFNYLSLGWPLVAREYDGELSKISGVAVGELRGGDGRVEGWGNLGIREVVWAGEGGGGEGGEGEGEGGGLGGSLVVTPTEAVGEDTNERLTLNPRWRALGRYVREWARQHPDLEGEERGEGAQGEWGDQAGRRKGSWAI